MNINLLKSAAVAEGNFLVSALLNNYIEDTNIKSPAATNGKILIINPNLFDELDTAQQYGTLCHEARHIMFKHKEIEEQLGLKHDLYNIATDIIVNEQVLAAGRKLPEGYKTREDYGIGSEFKSSIEIYNKLLELLQNQDNQNGDSSDENSGGQQDNNDGENEDDNGNNKGKENKDKLNNDLIDYESPNNSDIDMMAEASLGTDFSKEGDFARELLNNAKESKMNIWDYITKEVGRLTQPIWVRNFRRESRQVDGCIIPNYKGYQRVPQVKVFIDASGSMWDVIETIIKNLESIFKEGKMFKAKYLLFDTKIKEYNGKNLGSFGGGTDLELVGNSLDEADLYVVITDCEGDMKVIDKSDKNIIIFTNNTSYKGRKTINVSEDFTYIL